MRVVMVVVMMVAVMVAVVVKNKKLGSDDAFNAETTSMETKHLPVGRPTGGQS